MAVSSTLKKLILAIVALEFSFISHAHVLKSCKFDKIYNLGDSMSDTGNLIQEVGLGTFCARRPYGESYFAKPTGRCSNGLLMIDFIAMDAGLPFLPAYENKGADFAYGVNFAVAGSTALPWYTLAAENVPSSVTNSSLFVQLGWMSSHFNATCRNDRVCIKGVAKNALFMFGTIGGNDYNYALFQGKPIKQLRGMVPQVVNAISLGVRKVINHGATRVVVPGNFPIGCLPVHKTGFVNDTTVTYDENQCVNELNEFAKYHNQKLLDAIHQLQQENPNVAIVYADYYNAYLFMQQYAKSHGFDTHTACCGIGGKYNYDMNRMCGSYPGALLCSNPFRYVSWDGVHMTQEAFKIMTGWLLHQIFPNLHCN